MHGNFYNLPPRPDIGSTYVSPADIAPFTHLARGPEPGYETNEPLAGPDVPNTHIVYAAPAGGSEPPERIPDPEPVRQPDPLDHPEGGHPPTSAVLRILPTPTRLGPTEAYPARPKQTSDIIMPEGFMRGLLDRRIERVNSYFSQSFGLERAPLRTAIDRVQEVGRVSLLDVGCGTSETLRTWAERVREFADEPDRVRATGINLFDYSSIGMHAEKNRKAIESGAMDYKVGNAEHMPEIPDASMDVVLANTSVYHMDHPGAALREMDRVARPGAVLFLNAAAADQFNSSSPLMEEVFKLEDRGYTTEQRVGIAVDPKTSDYVEILFLRMEKPQQ